MKIPRSGSPALSASDDAPAGRVGHRQRAVQQRVVDQIHAVQVPDRQRAVGVVPQDVGPAIRIEVTDPYDGPARAGRYLVAGGDGRRASEGDPVEPSQVPGPEISARLVVPQDVDVTIEVEVS